MMTKHSLYRFEGIVCDSLGIDTRETIRKRELKRIIEEQTFDTVSLSLPWKSSEELNNLIYTRIFNEEF